MSAPAYLGDEVTGAGYRLAGASVRVPRAGEETAALAAARREASVVLLGASLALRIGDADLRAALTALSPLTMIVPDAVGDTPVPDIAMRLRRQLGVEA